MTQRTARLKGQELCVAGHDPVHGGAALVVWLLGQGALVTVTGMDDSPLSASLMRRVDEQLKRAAPDGRSFKAMLSRLSWTRRRRTDVVDAVSLFAASWPRRIVGIAGTHGKTTTALWAGHLIGNAVVAGHTPERPFVSILASRAKTAVIELASQGSLSHPRSSVVRTDDAERNRSELPFLQHIDLTAFSSQWGEHNVPNLTAALAAARLAGVPVSTLRRRVATLPQVPYRQEVVHRDAKLTVINDTMASTPEAGIAALRRWGGPTTILIAGGSGNDGQYRAWSRELIGRIRNTNAIFLSGGATQRMRAALRRDSFSVPAFGALESAWQAALDRAATYVSATILFSPATVAAQPYADALDRGRAFNAIVSATVKPRGR